MARILVIDDDENMLSLLQTTLELAGYSVCSALEGGRALELQRRRPVDLVITDIFMPDTDGIETIQQLRREFPAVKIIAISGGGDFGTPDNFLKVARRLGAIGVLQKPFDIGDLLGTVREVLEQSADTPPDTPPGGHPA